MGFTDELHETDEREELREENAATATANITPDWFDYLRQERNDFVTKFWEYWNVLPLEAKHSVWAENLLIAFDQMFETLALTYLHRLKRDFPDSAETELIRMTMDAVFGEFKQLKKSIDEKE